MSDIKIRKLREYDLQNGFLSSLDSLRPACSLNTAKEIFEKLEPNHIILVAELDGKIVGCVTILIEQKFIHGGRRAAHIEDVAVNKTCQNFGIGKKIMNYALNYTKDNDCYKTILYCNDDVKPFYEKLGFKPNGNSLRFDH